MKKFSYSSALALAKKKLWLVSARWKPCLNAVSQEYNLAKVEGGSRNELGIRREIIFDFFFKDFLVASGIHMYTSPQ